ncbi:transglutaminase-like cysteine peptidase [Brevundimonas staleyi]|uniref:Transglutaminase-like cysteine peptidase n=1 Tax=Brevundimonas staleyi TaxID=74326 RepID=A0ABW0FWB2_9CAUL
MKKIYSLAIPAIVAGIAMTAGAAQASDGVRMPLGQSTVAPVGFSTLCETYPQECAGPNASPQTLEVIRSWASRERWAAVFAEAGMSIAPTQPADIYGSDKPERSKPVMDAHAVRLLKDEARKASSRPDVAMKAGAPAPVRSAPRPMLVRDRVLPLPPRLTPPPPRMPEMRSGGATSALTMRDLQSVNTRLNRTIRSSTDLETFGEADVWNRPVGENPRGDCEDYVLAKRRALLDLGADPALMSIAIVRTRGGEVHAVLLVDMDGDELVLDNLSPRVLRWDQAPYTWIQRQAPRSPLTWVSAS